MMFIDIVSHGVVTTSLVWLYIVSHCSLLGAGVKVHPVICRQYSNLWCLWVRTSFYL